MTGSSRLKDDRGLTLVEMLVAMTILGVALAMFGATLFVMQKSQIRYDEYSRANDDVMLALSEMDRQVRSGYVISSTTYPGADAAVRIYTESNGFPSCVLWVLGDLANSGSQSLYTTEWDPTGKKVNFKNQAPLFSNGNKKEWRVVASDIVNGKAGQNANTFVTSAPPIGQLPTLNVYFLLFAGRDPLDRTRQQVEIKAEFASRNAPRGSEPPVGANANATKTGICG